METAGSIEEAAKEIPEKKESLRKAFEELKSLPSSHSFFTLQWEDLDGHFSSLQSSIDLGLHRLRALEPPDDPSTSALPPQPSSPSAVPPPELLAYCSATNGLGLRAYLWKNRTVILKKRNEVEAALRSAPDPARLVLRAISGYYEYTSGKETDQFLLRKSYLMLLEILVIIRPEISSDLAMEARQLAWKWKGRVPQKDERVLEAWALLQLVLAYRISGEFKVEELLDVIITVAKTRSERSVSATKELGLEEEHVLTLVKKLISIGKHTCAVKFICAFNLVEKFPPVPLLKEGIKETQKSAQELYKEGSVVTMNEAIAKETGVLLTTIRIIQEYNLESEYPIGPLQQQLDKLEKLKDGQADRRRAERKRNAAAASLTNSENKIIVKQQSDLAAAASLTNFENKIIAKQQQSQLPIGGPLPPVGAYTTAPLSLQQSDLAAAASLTNFENKIIAKQQSQLPIGGPLPPVGAYTTAPLSQPYIADRVPYLGSAGSYGMPGGGFYDRPGSGFSEPSIIPGSRLSPPRSYLYPPERQIPSNPYDRERALVYDRPVSYDLPHSFDNRPAAAFDRPGYGGKYGLL